MLALQSNLMAERLGLGPRAFVPFERLDYAVGSPHMIIKQTDIALTAHRESSNEVELLAGKDFLVSDTLDLIDWMEQGVVFDNQARGGLSREELKRALYTSGTVQRNNGFYAREAFRSAVAIWAQIPEYIKVVRFGRAGYSLSRRGRFAPPVTTIDTVEKLEELRSGTVDAATGKDTSARETAEVFFRVGASIPIRS